MSRSSAVPCTTNHRGEPRQVGVELELSGIELEVLARRVQAHFGGHVRPVSDYEHGVLDTEFGDFNVELDFAYLKALGRGATRSGDTPSDLERLSEPALAEVARHLVPYEIVTPPLPLEALEQVDALVADLRERGARGTRHSLVYAFGLHLNPDLPSLDADVIVAHVRAFLCLYDWLLFQEDVDWSRRLSPYINPYPKPYVEQVVDPRYAPSREGFMDHYLLHNADRNRALDLLPLLAFLDEGRVRRAIDDPRIKQRPTFHYRLPNCDVDLAGWGVSRPWSRWLEVERLASDRERLKRMSAAYQAYLAELLSGFGNRWREECEQWL